MEPTTSSEGSAEVLQPIQDEAGSSTPVLQNNSAETSSTQSLSTPTGDDAVTDDTPAESTQTEQEPQVDGDFAKYAQNKGFDPENMSEGERKALDMARNAEKKMHEALASSKQLESTMQAQPTLEYTGDPVIDELAFEVNQMKIERTVNDFFAAIPEAREYEQQMAEIVQQRPHLQHDLDALYALAANNPNRATELKQEGGRQALENLAQKQSAVPPTANASKGNVRSERITADNVDTLIAQNGQDWYVRNRAEINRVLAGY